MQKKASVTTLNKFFNQRNFLRLKNVKTKFSYHTSISSKFFFRNKSIKRS